jgi:uncharacterized damage-inducible protein DinB
MSKVRIGRPNETEAPPWSYRYIKLVEGDDILGVLAAQREIALPYLAAISEERSLFRYAPGKWSIRQMLNHISDGERIFAYRALWFARGFGDPLPDFEENTAALGAEADRLPWTVHVEEFDRVRLATISLFQNMPQAGWTRKGIASGNSVTVRAIAFLIAGHCAHHLNALREKYS